MGDEWMHRCHENGPDVVAVARNGARLFVDASPPLERCCLVGVVVVLPLKNGA